MPNTITEKIDSNYRPKLAVMVYQHENEFYLESHDVNEAGHIMAGKPLLQETIQEIVDCFFDERKSSVSISGILPTNLLNYTTLPGGNYRMVWFRPAENIVLHHKEHLKIKTAKAWVPSTLYICEKNYLYVYALKNDNRPVELTKLYKAPFFNVDDNGQVCLGSARVQKPKVKTYANLMQYWEDLFWLSEFTHVNGSDKVKSKDMQKLWRSLVGTRKRFPVTELLVTQKTVKDIL